MVYEFGDEAGFLLRDYSHPEIFNQSVTHHHRIIFSFQDIETLYGVTVSVYCHDPTRESVEEHLDGLILSVSRSIYNSIGTFVKYCLVTR